MPRLDPNMITNYLQKGDEKVYTKLKSTITSTADYAEACANYSMLKRAISERKTDIVTEGNDFYMDATNTGLTLGCATLVGGCFTPPAAATCGAVSVVGSCVGFFGKFVKENYLLSKQEFLNIKGLARAASVMKDLLAPKQTKSNDDRVSSYGLRKRY